MARKRIGELLLENGVISRHQLEAALMIQKQTRARLGITLISQGFVSEEALAAGLSQALGVPLVELKGQTPDWAAIHMLRARFCELNEVFPFGIEKNGARKALLVAMADPLNSAAIQEIEFTTGLPVATRLATLSQVRSAILRYYHKVNPDLAGEGKMALVQRGGAVRVVDTEAPVEEPQVVMGRELPPDEPTPNEMRALEQLIDQRQAASQKRKGAVAKDLQYLFGETDPQDELEKLEKKFWALMRLMARKGLITKDEFRQELDEGEEP
ncbi:MAG: general secretion pathway protein GspE [Archangiaceae bacterium]|nr:general secretion pathway protein GspE [Archangiaceae bacterium]